MEHNSEPQLSTTNSKLKNFWLNNKPKTKSAWAGFIIGSVMILLLLPVLVINFTIIIKGIANPDEVPSVFGLTPRIVLSQSMEPEIMTGDLVFSKNITKEDLEKLKNGEYNNKNLYVTYKIYEGNTDEFYVETHVLVSVIPAADGKFIMETKGLNPNPSPVLQYDLDNIIGIYSGRIPKLGYFAEFVSKPLGMILCIILPLTAFVIVLMFSTGGKDKSSLNKTKELEAEIARLKALADKNSNANTGESDENSEKH